MSKENESKKVAYKKPIVNSRHMARKLMPLYLEWVAAGRPCAGQPAQAPRQT